MEPLFFRLGNEVRQGLHHILGLMELVAEEQIYLDRCREAADQLQRTAGDLAELARPSGPPTRANTFNASDAIGEIACLMGALAERKGLSLTYSADPKFAVRVVGDEYVLQDMIRRLLDNAIRFTTAGSIHFKACCTGMRGDYAIFTFEISDTGPGIPQDVLNDFEADVSEPRMQGLSLRILRKRLKESNGQISIVPNSPHGATIRLSLPVTIVEAKPDDVAANVPGCSLSSLKLLIAEDSDDSFLLFKSYVKAEGHQVARALNGAQAVEMAKDGDYDFIVMDVNMPRVDGYSATRQIREWETEQRRPRLPILLLSADDLERQVRIGGAAGCSGYLSKPTSKAQVLAALNYYSNAPHESAGSFIN